MSSPLLPAHPMVADLGRLSAVVDALAAPDPAYLGVADAETVSVGLHRAIDRLQAVLARLLATGADVADEHGARSAGTWLAHRVVADAGPVRRLERLGGALDRRWPTLSAALLAGCVGLGQAEAIASGLDQLPATTSPELRSSAEAHLVEQAEHFAPRQLRVLARRVLEVVAPEVADDEERRLLERELDAARAATSLSLRPRGDGTTELRGRVPDVAAGRLRTYLEAFAAPRRQASSSAQPSPRRLGAAFCSLLEALPAEVLPLHGGTATTVVVTVPLDSLRASVGVAATDGGEHLPAGEVRRLACTAAVVPAVLGGRSEVLDLGRSSRLFSPAQRRALALRDGTCRALGCDIPAAWTEAHHLKPWSRGGRTDLADGVLLCAQHHHRIHDERYETTRSATGRIQFHRRT